MLTDYREALKAIRTFPSLIRFLRDEMDWPIESEDFEELTFAYSPEELGIDAKNAAKIQEIKRLRRLSAQPPWGIFFVKFEPKRLPVVALRRILNRVALKKRASANSADRAAWSADDLLFISNYGEGESRQISFAHFSQSETKKDLPTLKVLGWDNLDTSLHLDHVAEVLIEQLVWPDDEDDESAWRKQWRAAFTLAHREVITTSKRLSIELAKLARNIRDRISAILTIETEDGPVTQLMVAFRQALVHDLDEDGFADMYAQTITYGLISARVANPSGDGTAANLTMAMPVTSPFLKELMETFFDAGRRGEKADSTAVLDFDELGVNEVIELLDIANMEAVVRDFGDRNPQQDPVIHFYEDFLAAYDMKQKVRRGVFYTPLPVVSFIVRSVDELLRTEYGLEDGLADTTTWGKMAERFDGLEIPEGAMPSQPFVQILDPATGTGTFLVEAIGLIHKTMTEKWGGEGHNVNKIEELWNDYVPKHLLPRLYGYELMMAPYAIAHMKIGLKLYETGYRFGSDMRTQIYLTNSLEPPSDIQQRTSALPALAHEAKAVSTIKRNHRFTVVIGNPPYAVKSYNRSQWIQDLLTDFKRDLNETKINLDDDFIKFLRFAAHLLALSKQGVVGMITNNVFLTGVTHRQMRRHLLEQFPISSFYNLHGDSRYGEVPPLGIQNENVFDIQQGVSISILTPSGRHCSRVNYADVWGSRSEKAQCLLGKSPLELARIHPAPPLFLISPPSRDDIEGYDEWPSLAEWMPVHSNGIETHKDALTLHFNKRELQQTVEFLLSSSLEDSRNRLCIGEDGRDWKLANAVDSLRSMVSASTSPTTITYRPFDVRHTMLNHESGGFIAYPRWEVMSHLVTIPENIAIVSARLQVRGGVWDSCLATRFPTEKKTGDSTRSSTLFPLFISGAGLLSGTPARSNFSHGIITQLHERVPAQSLQDTDVLSYLYAVLHSPGYRNRYSDALKSGFPRIPLPSTETLYRELYAKGIELVSLHLLESSRLDSFATTLVGSGDFEVVKVSYSNETVWIDKEKTRGFQGVPDDVWNFHIGGYQVCEKWLKDRQAKGGKSPRPGRVLSAEDIDHYQKIVVALSETIRIMTEIDEVIETHGGWPDAFARN